MPIHVDLNVIMAKRHISAGELAEKIDITPVNLKPRQFVFLRWNRYVKS